jgi:hypothetical protein
MKKDAVKIELGEKFKKRSPVSGTNVYRAISTMKHAWTKNEYRIDVEIISTTQTKWNEIGKRTTIFFKRSEYGRWTQVQIVN